MCKMTLDIIRHIGQNVSDDPENMNAQIDFHLQKMHHGSKRLPNPLKHEFYNQYV